MPITYEKLEKKIKQKKYPTLAKASFYVRRTMLSKHEKILLTKLATDIYDGVTESAESKPVRTETIIKRELQLPSQPDESILSKLDHRSTSAKAEPERIIAFSERLTDLAFHFLSIAVDFKLSKEELGRKLAAKLKVI